MYNVKLMPLACWAHGIRRLDSNFFCQKPLLASVQQFTICHELKMEFGSTMAAASQQRLLINLFLFQRGYIIYLLRNQQSLLTTYFFSPIRAFGKLWT